MTTPESLVIMENLPSPSPAIPGDDVLRLLKEAETRHIGGDLSGAVVFYQQAIALLPVIPEAYDVLGIALFDLGRFGDAVTCCRQAIVLRPDYPHAHFNLASAWRAQGQTGIAIPLYHRAIILGHNRAECLLGLGIAHFVQEDRSQAVIAYHRAIAQQPDYAEAYCNLGIVLCDLYDIEDSAVACRRALALRPNYPRALNSLGNALQALGRIDQAVAAYHAAIALQPDYAEPINNLSNALVRQGHLTEAIAGYEQALVLAPNDPRIHLVYSMALLKRGRLREGWEEFEWRWLEQAPDRKTLVSGRPRVPQPEWIGQPLEGRTILLYTEHGLGDALQFVRYAPILADRGARVVLTVFPGLVRLMRLMPGVADAVSLTDPMPPFDYHLSMMSVPRVVGTELDSIPATIPYIRAEPAEIAAWRDRVAALPGLKVGLAWAGDPRPHNRGAYLMDALRSMRLDQFAGLGGIDGVTLVSLQKGAPAQQTRTLPAGLKLVDWTDELKDFADTAALVSTLDLVITVDTSIVHVAGALGIPVWILSRFAGCWRWLEDRTDTPWYPTARLYHQRVPREWDEVLSRIRNDLISLVAAAHRDA